MKISLELLISRDLVHCLAIFWTTITRGTCDFDKLIKYPPIVRQIARQLFVIS